MLKLLQPSTIVTQPITPVINYFHSNYSKQNPVLPNLKSVYQKPMVPLSKTHIAHPTSYQASLAPYNPSRANKPRPERHITHNLLEEKINLLEAEYHLALTRCEQEFEPASKCKKNECHQMHCQTYIDAVCKLTHSTNQENCQAALAIDICGRSEPNNQPIIEKIKQADENYQDVHSYGWGNKIGAFG